MLERFKTVDLHPDAVDNPTMGTIFNRYFHRYTPPRPLAEIEADIRGIETDIMRMLSEVTGGAPASEPRQD